MADHRNGTLHAEPLVRYDPLIEHRAHYYQRIDLAPILLTTRLTLPDWEHGTMTTDDSGQSDPSGLPVSGHGEQLPGQQQDSEPFSSCDLAGLKDVDGFGELPGLPRAAAEFAQDAPGLQLGVGTLAGGSELGVGAVGVFLGGGLVSSPVGSKDVLPGAVVALVGQCDQPGGGQFADESPGPGGGQVMDGAGQGAGDS